MHEGFRPEVDERSRSLRAMSAIRSAINDGKVFEVIGVVPALSGSSVVYRGFVTPSDRDVYLEPSTIFSTVSGATNLLYEGASFTGGAPVKIFNRDRNSANESVVRVCKLVTPGTLGTDIIDVVVAGVGGNPANDQGGRSAGDLDNVIVLKRNTSYVFEMKNIGSVATDVYYSHLWIEEV